MTKTTELVINASPTVALVAALGDLHVLQLYQRVWVPFEVCNEIIAGGAAQFAVPEFVGAHWLQKNRDARHSFPTVGQFARCRRGGRHSIGA